MSRFMRPTVMMTAVSMALWAAVAGAGDLPEEYAFVQKLFPSVEIDSAKPSPVDGLLELSVGADIYYVSADGKYFFQGQLFDLETREDLTEKSRIVSRAAYFDSLDYSTAITFAAENEKYRVLVFTDIDCGYCRKLHREMDDYNALGITVQYMFFPRSGPGKASWFKAESVWCSESRKDALTAAKQDRDYPSADCGETPVAMHYQLGKDLGIRGTPAIFTETGELLEGYREPPELLKVLAGES